jgi:hypothetical protein
MVSFQCAGRTIRLKKMRVSIREQLALLVLFTALTSLMVLALATVRPLPILFRPVRPKMLTYPVVPKQVLYHRNSTLRPVIDRVSEGRSDRLYPDPVPKPDPRHRDPVTHPECFAAVQRR